PSSPRPAPPPCAAGAGRRLRPGSVPSYAAKTTTAARLPSSSIPVVWGRPGCSASALDPPAPAPPSLLWRRRRSPTRLLSTAEAPVLPLPTKRLHAPPMGLFPVLPARGDSGRMSCKRSSFVSASPFVQVLTFK